MPDPQVLYVVTAAVVLGLVVWVAIVLSRPATGRRAGERDSTPPSEREGERDGALPGP